MYVLFDVCVGTGFVDCFEKGLYMKRVLKCEFAYCPEVTVCGWQGVENPVTDFRIRLPGFVRAFFILVFLSYTATKAISAISAT